MMASPDPKGGYGDMPIRCFYCDGETTMTKIVTSPDGHPCCISCYNEKFRKEFTLGKDIEELV